MLERLKRFFTRKTNRTVVSSPKTDELAQTHVAILATDGFEQSELFGSKTALEEVGACVSIISPHSGKIMGWNHGEWGKSINVDATINDSWSTHFDYLMIPGGVLNSDRLRINDEVVAFIMSFINRHRPIAAICHGPQLFIETGGLKGVTLTSSPSIRTDLQNAGARWIDQEVVVDHHFITSRRASDLQAFNRAMIQEFVSRKIYPPLPNTEGYVVTL